MGSVAIRWLGAFNHVITHLHNNGIHCTLAAVERALEAINSHGVILGSGDHLWTITMVLSVGWCAKDLQKEYCAKTN